MVDNIFKKKLASIKNEHVSVLDSYKVSPFKESHSDTACIVRIIEIYSLNKLR